MAGLNNIARKISGTADSLSFSYMLSLVVLGLTIQMMVHSSFVINTGIVRERKY